ncbi:hypothetical protein JTB14_017259 [Gonioctena quinquepunctata]|nr:hypothetical protein JTB14_017259 [Gonioctena quinquepunctata]
MSANSPFKDAYEYYKKCSKTGNCVPPAGNVKGGSEGFGAIDVKKNPFLNGVYEVGSPASFASSSSSSSGFSASSSAGTKSDGISAFHSGASIDVSNNPFLNGQFATAGNGDKIRGENGFLGVQPKTPGFATTHPLANKQPFATTKPGGQQQQQSFVLGGNVKGNEITGQENQGGRFAACKGQGYICVNKGLCSNGIVNKNGQGLLQVRTNAEYCDIKTQECCRLPRLTEGSQDFLLPNTPGKSSFPTSINDLLDSVGKSPVKGSNFKFSGGAGSSPGRIQILTDDSLNSKTQVFHAGESGSELNTFKPTRDTTPSANSVFSSTPDYSNVQFDSNVRFSSLLHGPAYLPPLPETTPSISTYEPSIPTTPAPSCPFGTIRKPDGSCERPTTPTFLWKPDGSCERPTTPTPSCPFGTIRKPAGSCERPTTPAPYCPSGTIRKPDGSCETPTPSCPFGTIRKPDGNCERPTTPSCPFGTIRKPDGGCERATTPAPSCPFGTIRRPDGSCEAPTTPTPSCPFGTIRKPDGSCERPTTPAPSCPFGTIRKPDGSLQHPTDCGSCEPLHLLPLEQ